jgi:hypothetical protein
MFDKVLNSCDDGRFLLTCLTRFSIHVMMEDFYFRFDRRWIEDYSKRPFGVCTTTTNTYHLKGHQRQEPSVSNKLNINNSRPLYVLHFLH